MDIIIANFGGAKSFSPTTFSSHGWTRPKQNSPAMGFGVYGKNISRVLPHPRVYPSEEESDFSSFLLLYFKPYDFIQKHRALVKEELSTADTLRAILSIFIRRSKVKYVCASCWPIQKIFDFSSHVSYRPSCFLSQIFPCYTKDREPNRTKFESHSFIHSFIEGSPSKHISPCLTSRTIPTPQHRTQNRPGRRFAKTIVPQFPGTYSDHHRLLIQVQSSQCTCRRRFKEGPPIPIV